MNPGKEFEFNFRKSALTDNVYIERLKDHGYMGNDNGQRFTPSNDYDFEMLYKGVAFKLELKSVKGKSLPMSDDRQLKRLLKVQILLENCGVKNKVGYVIEFREVQKVAYIDAEVVKAFLGATGKKSINYSDVSGAGGVEIDFTIPRIKPKYKIMEFCERFYQGFRKKV